MQKPESLASLRKKFAPPKNVNASHRKSLSSLEKLALIVTEKIGTMGFFFIILGLMLQILEKIEKLGKTA